MRITEENLTERKKRLLHAAYELFCENGIDGVTLSQIAKKSDISLNAIYHYYDSKATLLQHTQKILWEEIVAQILRDAKERILSAKNGLEEISVLLFNFEQFYQNHSRYLMFACDYKLFLVRNNLKLSKEVYGEILAPVYKTFTEALSRGQADGSISKRETVESQYFAIWGIARGYVEQMVVFDKMYDDKNPLSEHLHLVLQYTLEGLKNTE